MDARTNWKKYRQYNIDVDPNQNDKAKEIRLCDFSRPHMRAFHCSWWSFFIAFFVWFAATPLLPAIRGDLGLSKKEVWTSSLISVGSTIIIRFVLGPLCDKYGARTLFAITLCTISIPTACIGLVRHANDLYILRGLTGLAGGTFVMCQYWTSMFFVDDIVGTANALAAGWGNLGAGATELIIGSGIHPFFQYVLDNDDEVQPWRYVCIIPAIIAFMSGVVVYYISDDSPKGNYKELKNNGTITEISATKAFIKAGFDHNTWVLYIQYACCFGVELTMNNAAALYFRDEFGQSIASASAIASIFGWMNLFARGIGGFISDYACARLGMQGRLIVQFILLFGEGAMVLIFARTSSLSSAVISLVFFSLFVQAAEGSSFGIVPFVQPSVTGSVTGIVGAGGNVGAVCFGFAFRELDYRRAFQIMGISVLGSAFLSFIVRIKDHSWMLTGVHDKIKSQTVQDESENDDSGDSSHLEP